MYLPDSVCISPIISLSFSLLGFFILKLSLGDLFGVFNGLGDFTLNLSFSDSCESKGNELVSVGLGDGLFRPMLRKENDPALLGDRVDLSEELGLSPTGINAGLFKGSILKVIGKQNNDSKSIRTLDQYKWFFEFSEK